MDIKEIHIYNSEVELQSLELNLVLRKAAMIAKEVPCAPCQFRKSSVRILKFFREIM